MCLLALPRESRGRTITLAFVSDAARSVAAFCCSFNRNSRPRSACHD